MSKVNPPPQLRIPEGLVVNGRTGQPDRESFSYLRQINTILWQLWVRTGGGDDNIESSSEDLRQFEDLTVKHPRPRNVVSTSSNYTTTEDDIVICVNSGKVTITLNDEPEDLEVVTIKNTLSTVSIDGNGKTIDGFTLLNLAERYHSVDLVYSVVNDAWSVI